MADFSLVRKSTRVRVPNRRYSSDISPEMNTSGSDTDILMEPTMIVDDSKKDADFAIDQIVENISGENTSTEDNDTDESTVLIPNSDGIGNDDGVPPTTREYRRIRPTRKKIQGRPEKDTHSRGIVLPDIATRDSHMKFLYGTDSDDLLRFVQSRDTWVSDVTLPSCIFDKDGQDASVFSLTALGDGFQSIATAGSEWFFSEGGYEEILRKQNQRLISGEEAATFLPKSSPSLNFLMGPYAVQTMYSLDFRHTMSLDQAESFEAIGSTALFTESENTRIGAYGEQKGAKPGWMLNIGARITCLGWAPDHAETQYLMAATHQKPASKNQMRSAFEPSVPYPASMQLWAFEGSTKSTQRGVMDLTRPPRLVQVTCTLWGAVKHLCWCPFISDLTKKNDEGKIFIGLLAAVWSDGFVRLLNVQISANGETSSIYVLYQDAAFEAKPPSTICTCITWLSDTILAAGCANGFGAIWNIAEGMTQDHAPSRTNFQDPYFYQYLHQSYILSITSCYPDQPYLLITSSIDGYMRLTDLRAPTSDFVLAKRNRCGPCTIVYHSQLQCALAPDDTDFVRALPLRRFFSDILIAKASGQVLSLAAGKTHSSILAGCTDGSVIVTNPMRKMLNTKSLQYQQIWFRHAWIEKQRSVVPLTEPEIETLLERREGLSRITEGYKVESHAMSRNKGHQMKEGGAFTTIHEPESGVNQVAWNPNRFHGGWAVAAMGTGLVRVEDLSI